MWWLIAGIAAYYLYQKYKEDQMRVTYTDQNGKVVSIDDIKNVVVEEDGAVPPPVHTCPTGYHWDEMNQSCIADIPIPPIPPIPPAPGPGDGTRNNPFKMTRYADNGLGYTVQFSNTTDMVIPGQTKLYFEVDPASVGINPGIIMMHVMGYNNENLRFYQLMVDRTTEAVIKPETQIYQNYGFSINIWNRLPYTFDKVKYIFAIENVGQAAGIKVFWSI